MTGKIVRAFNLIEKLDDIYHNGLPDGVTTGWIDLDEFYTVMKGQFTIITGVPSHGKSEFLDALMVNLAVKHCWKFAVFSPENHPIEMHMTKIAQKFIGKPYGRNFNNHMSKEEAARAIDFIDDCFRFYTFENNEFDINDVLSLTRHSIQENNIDGLIIDPWNEIDSARPQGMTETEYVSRVLSKLRSFSRANDIHIWQVAHPKKPDSGRDYLEDPPNLYDVSGSAHWYNKADVGITVHRPDVFDGTEVHIYVSKVRFRNIGKPTGGNPVILNYDKYSGRYS